MSQYHTPVLLEESVGLLAVEPAGTYADLTFGGGGHSRRILSALGPEGRLYGFDQDRDTLENRPDDARFHYVESNFRFLRGALRLRGVTEVDGILGTGSYGDICAAIDEVMGASGLRPCHLGSIHTAPQDGGRILSTPPWYAYLRIAEGCDNHCAYCVIPSLRGKYRSRPMEGLLEEARELADAGVKELLVIAQDITRYGTDLNGEHQLASLLRELCRLDFHWVRLHYLYPDEITEELIDTIAEEPKIVKYLDIPIQHCNDKVLDGDVQIGKHLVLGGDGVDQLIGCLLYTSPSPRDA